MSRGTPGLAAVVAAMLPALPGCSVLVNTRTSASGICEASYTAPVADTIAMVVLVAGGVYANSTIKEPKPCTGELCFDLSFSEEVRFLSAVALAGGVIAAASAAYGYASVPGCRRTLAARREGAERARLEQLETVRARDREAQAQKEADEKRGRRVEALRLTKEAAAAARTDGCAIVNERSPQVRDLDLEFYTDVFLRDVAIKACLGP